MAKILLTGATGFIGKRLLYSLIEQGHEIYALSRIKGVGVGIEDHPRVHVIYGDLREFSFINQWPKDIDAAYFLVHSMSDVVKNLEEVEVATALNFLKGLEHTNCRQIIYLGGIIENPDDLSPHLKSRLAVEKILSKSRIPCTLLRASVIIGEGSASFEIIRDLVEILPVMIAPRWVKSLCQPIAVNDVIFYLKEILLNEKSFGQTYDLGGPEAMSFQDVLLKYAAYRNLKRWVINVPVLTPRLSSYWLLFVTSVPFSLCFYLVESMKHNTRKLNTAIDTLIPHRCTTYEKALEIAFQRTAQNEVFSTWMDAWNLEPLNASIQHYVEVPKRGCLKDIRKVSMGKSSADIKKNVWSVGGETGWYSMNWAWKLRGLIDKLIGGKGLNRGRKHPSEIHVGDSIDFWRVLKADEKEGHLILYAEMKLPGEAWLEFEIDEESQTLTQTATFRPKGVLGRLYWYSLIPFHAIIFKNMAKSLATK